MLPLRVLFEDNHCLAVEKPARLPVVGDETGDESLLDRAREYLKEKYRKPGNVFLGVVHRLDRPVSGVVLFARTSKAAARLSEQFRAGTVRKVYHALVEGAPDPAADELVDWLIKDERLNVSRAVAAGTPGAKECSLSYRTLAAAGERGLSLVEVVPRTGRSHQIRVQLSRRGWPIAGDRKYGAETALGGAIALHAAELTFEHPVTRAPVVLAAPRPPEWERLLSE